MREVIGELRPLGLLALHDLGNQLCHLLHMAAQPPQQFGILGQTLGQNVPRAFQRGLGIRHRLGDEPCSQTRRVRRTILKDRLQKRPQPVLACNHRPRAALGLVGQVDILQLRLGRGLQDLRLQRIGHLPLFGDGGQDRRPPRLHLAQIGQPLRQRPQLGIVQPARHLFAIARDEGNGGPFIQKADGRRHLRRLRADLCGDDLGDAAGGIGSHARPLV